MFYLVCFLLGYALDLKHVSMVCSIASCFVCFYFWQNAVCGFGQVKDEDVRLCARAALAAWVVATSRFSSSMMSDATKGLSPRDSKLNVDSQVKLGHEDDLINIIAHASKSLSLCGGPVVNTTLIL